MAAEKAAIGLPDQASAAKRRSPFWLDLQALIPECGHILQILLLNIDDFSYGRIQFGRQAIGAIQQLGQLLKSGAIAPADGTAGICPMKTERRQGCKRIGWRSASCGCTQGLSPVIHHGFLELLGSFHPLGIKIHSSQKWATDCGCNSSCVNPDSVKQTTSSTLTFFQHTTRKNALVSRRNCLAVRGHDDGSGRSHSPKRNMVGCYRNFFVLRVITYCLGGVRDGHAVEAQGATGKRV